MRIDLPTSVVTCTGCAHWQADFHPRAVRDLGPVEVLQTTAELHDEHLRSGECVNPDGRIKVAGRWVDRPVMESGNQATGVLAGEPLPRWWVWR